MIHERRSGETSRQMSEFFGSPQSDKHPPQRNKGSNSKCPAYLPPTLHCSAAWAVYTRSGPSPPADLWPWESVRGRMIRETEGRRGRMGPARSSPRLAHQAAALRCPPLPSFPPVIILYDLLCSKCYINLVTPHDYTPRCPHATHTHTHRPYHANIVIPAHNFLLLLALTPDLMAV